MKFTINTKGHGDVIDITDQVVKIVEQAGNTGSAVLVFVAGTTAGITVMEYEPGPVADFAEILDKIAPEQGDYKHHKKWGDYNGAAHFNASRRPASSGCRRAAAWSR